KPNLVWLNVYGRDFSTVRSWRNAQTLAAKGRLIRCTVLGSTPKRAAIFRPRCVQATLERQGFVFLIRALSGAANAISPKSRTLEVPDGRQGPFHLSGHHQRAHCLCGSRRVDLLEYLLARGFRPALAQGICNRLARSSRACFYRDSLCAPRDQGHHAND